MWQNVAISLMLAQAPETLTPADAMVAAHADLEKLAPSVRPYVRYLSLQVIPPEDRKRMAGVISGTVNGLSVNGDIKTAELVSGFLLRLNFKHYGWKTEVWESFKEPYFSTEIERIYDTKDAYGRWGVHKKFRERAVAPWLAEGAAQKAIVAQVVEWTGSKAPVVLGNWFHAQVALQEGRSPGYYDFLGIKDQKTFEALIRFDAKLASELERRQVVTFSGVTRQPRRVERTASVLGGVHRTFDSIKAVGKNNPLRFLDDVDFQFDATEQFAPLPNGMPAWYLGDSKGKRQDKAPDNIVKGDPHGLGGSTTLHVNISCIRCHFLGKNEDGIKEVKAVRIREFSSEDYDKILELERQYKRDVSKKVAADRAAFRAAILEATGMEPHEWAKGYEELFSGYEDAHFDLALTARYVGVSEKELARVFILEGKKLDSAISEIAGGGAIPTSQFEEVYHLIQEAVFRHKRTP